MVEDAAIDEDTADVAAPVRVEVRVLAVLDVRTLELAAGAPKTQDESARAATMGASILEEESVELKELETRGDL
jgi:hypothetical protein